jgi:hypothetical protein
MPGFVVFEVVRLLFRQKNTPFEGNKHTRIELPDDSGSILSEWKTPYFNSSIIASMDLFTEKKLVILLITSSTSASGQEAPLVINIFVNLFSGK